MPSLKSKMDDMDENLNFQKVIFDCNVWLEIFLDEKWDLMHKIFRTNKIILTSYCVVEILRVLRRLSIRLKKNFTDLESLIWEFWNQPGIEMKFDVPISDHLITEIKNCVEYNIISQLLHIETKDVPYIVAAYQFNATLVSKDERSITRFAEILKSKLAINVISWENFVKKF